MLYFDAPQSTNGAESISSKAITVTQTAASGQNVTVDYAVTGNATGSGTDYTLANGTLTINAGSTSGTITIAGIVYDGGDDGKDAVKPIFDIAISKYNGDDIGLSIRGGTEFWFPINKQFGPVNVIEAGVRYSEDNSGKYLSLIHI